MISIKLRGWERALIGYLGECAKQSFRPGTLDCAMFFAGGVKAMTGVDFGKKYLGKYRTLEEGYELLASEGYENHIDFVETIFPVLPSPLMAQRGDGAVVPDGNNHPALGIVQGEGIYMMTLNGLTIYPLTAATKAFRI